MGVVSAREVSGRTLTHRFGDPPNADRRFVVTLDNTAPSVTEVANYLSIRHGSPHPEFSFLTMTEAVMTEGSPSPFHCEVTFRYELLQPDARDPNPLARPDIWTFSTSGAAVPALYYWEVNQRRPLVNSALDFFEGLQTEEAEVRATITANRERFPLLAAIGLTNRVNGNAYLGAPPYTWKCAGISGQQQIEMVNNVEVRYWSISTELVYRESGWPLQIPNVGYNYLEQGFKKRAYVLFEGEKVPTVNPVALNDDGSLFEGGVPSILVRRVHEDADFSEFIGTPSWL